MPFFIKSLFYTLAFNVILQALKGDTAHLLGKTSCAESGILLNKLAGDPDSEVAEAARDTLANF